MWVKHSAELATMFSDTLAMPQTPVNLLRSPCPDYRLRADILSDLRDDTLVCVSAAHHDDGHAGRRAAVLGQRVKVRLQFTCDLHLHVVPSEGIVLLNTHRPSLTCRPEIHNSHTHTDRDEP